MKTNTIIGIIFQTLQKDAQLTDKQVSEYLKISQKEYKQIIKGEKGVELTILRKLNDLYGIDEYIIPEYAHEITNNIKIKNTPEEYENMGLESISRLNQTTKYLKIAHGLSTENGFMEIK